MYPVTLGLEGAKERINSLISSGYHAESFVTSVFTVEKTIRRVLRQIIVSAGFKSKIADKIISRISGFDNLNKSWEIYEPKGEKLTFILDPSVWKNIKDASAMRNKIIHGQRVYSLSECKDKTKQVLESLDSIVLIFQKKYGYDGWSKAAMRKKSMLHNDPKVKI